MTGVTLRAAGSFGLKGGMVSPRGWGRRGQRSV